MGAWDTILKYGGKAFAFPPSFGLPEFFAVWVLSFFVSLLAVIAFFQYLPYWHARQFGIGAFLVFSLFRV